MTADKKGTPLEPIIITYRNGTTVDISDMTPIEAMKLVKIHRQKPRPSERKNMMDEDHSWH
jgi:hypothetical protein